MLRLHSLTFLVAIVVAVSATAACSGSSPQSPVGPSATGAPLPSAFQTSSEGLSPTATNRSPGAPMTPRGPKLAGEGTVASLSGECPTLTMVVRGVRVTTTDETTYEIGECGNLRAGSKVRVEGEFETDGSLTATSIVLTDQPGGRPVAGEGTVGALRGTCPTLTMVVRGYPVMTTSTTTFSGGECVDLHSGSRISVTGDLFANSVLATEVKLLPAVQ